MLIYWGGLSVYRRSHTTMYALACVSGLSNIHPSQVSSPRSLSLPPRRDQLAPFEYRPLEAMESWSQAVLPSTTNIPRPSRLEADSSICLPSPLEDSSSLEPCHDIRGSAMVCAGPRASRCDSVLWQGSASRPGAERTRPAGCPDIAKTHLRQSQFFRHPCTSTSELPQF